MSLQSDFFTLAGPIFTGRVYPNVAPDLVEKPYLTYSRISGLEETTLDTNGGVNNLRNTRLQLDVWAATYGEAQAKAEALRTALKTWAVPNVFQSDQDMYEADTKLHRVMLDISTWHE